MNFHKIQDQLINLDHIVLVQLTMDCLKVITVSEVFEFYSGSEADRIDAFEELEKAVLSYKNSNTSEITLNYDSLDDAYRHIHGDSFSYTIQEILNHLRQKRKYEDQESVNIEDLERFIYDELNSRGVDVWRN